MATSKLSKKSALSVTEWALIQPEHLNRNLSQYALKAFDAVNATQTPCYKISWTDLYRVFQNSRRLVRETNRLDPRADPDIQALIKILSEDHEYLRGVLFLVLIENLLRLGHENAMHVLWIYGEQMECVDQMSERLKELDAAKSEQVQVAA